jgi:ABC-2 type transport system permease protein
MGDPPTDPALAGNATPLVQLTLARLREFYREPAAVFWVYGFPLLLAVALGVAFRNQPVERIRVDITATPGATAAAESLREKLATDPRLDLTVVSAEEGRNRLRTAKTDLVVSASDEPGAMHRQYLLEPNRPESVLARNAVDNVLLRTAAPGVPTPVEVTIDEPGGRYIDFLIPGLIGTNLMGGGLWGVGFVTVDMRVRKLLKRFLATPMRKRDFLFSLMLSRLVFTLVEILILIGFAYLVFDIRVRGSLPAFLALLVAGGLCFAGIGLLVACRAKTIETVSGLMNAVMLPMYVLSGVFFSSDRFPDVMQPLVQALPLTPLNDGLRAVMNDGAGFEAVAVPLALLAAWGIVSFALALRFFRWR